jgi:hypothetical protein
MQLSDALIREFSYCEDRMHAASGDDHAYWLGKCVGIADALAIVHETDWVTAHNALWRAAHKMRQQNATA